MSQDSECATVPVEEWISALRSGDYEQGVGKLRRADDTFCCLGVLCDLSDPDGWDPPATDGVASYAHRGGSRSFVPPTVANANPMLLTLVGHRPNTMLRTLVEHRPLARHLMEMNDVHCKSFAEIADYLEGLVEGGVIA